MARYALFLRGVNLGSKRKTGSAELRDCLGAAGFEDVQTFRTSGNVVFDAGRKPGKAKIERALADSFGFEVEVFLRTAAEVRAIADHEPFDPSLVEASGGKLQVALLHELPSAAKRKQVLALGTDADRLAFGERELYWLPSGNMRDSGINLNGVAKLVGTNTMRTKGTIELLGAKFFDDA
jgi:uncharacterized protein (DUF1697 family)